MMIRLILGVALIIVILMLLRQTFPDAKSIRNVTISLLLIAAITVLIALGVTGRLHWLVSLFGAVLIAMPKLIKVLRYATPMQQAYAKMKDAKETPPPSNSLSVQEAYDVLGLAAEASREEIIKAHRKLIQKIHPDRGGSDYLANKINQAKEVLLQSYDSR